MIIPPPPPIQDDFQTPPQVKPPTVIQPPGTGGSGGLQTGDKPPGGQRYLGPPITPGPTADQLASGVGKAPGFQAPGAGTLEDHPVPGQGTIPRPKGVPDTHHLTWLDAGLAKDLHTFYGSNPDTMSHVIPHDFAPAFNAITSAAMQAAPPQQMTGAQPIQNDVNQNQLVAPDVAKTGAPARNVTPITGGFKPTGTPPVLPPPKPVGGVFGSG